MTNIERNDLKVALLNARQCAREATTPEVRNLWHEQATKCSELLALEPTTERFTMPRASNTTIYVDGIAAYNIVRDNFKLFSETDVLEFTRRIVQLLNQAN